MAARCPGMEPSPGCTSPRRLSLRGACLTLALLCALAVTTGALARANEPGHHHHHAVAAATTGPDTVAAHGKRGAPDLAAAEGPVPPVEMVPAAATARATRALHDSAAAPVRTRGPPATG